ncbi:hypothetical protein, partial [Escherichia coli]|uniref:hypothetical protein n=1 Tax=Escherichia coli TaxID=562 RepID=UPI000BCBEB0A
IRESAIWCGVWNKRGIRFWTGDGWCTDGIQKKAWYACMKVHSRIGDLVRCLEQTWDQILDRRRVVH